MQNFYSFKDNEIFINAPGKTNKNRIKNYLIWDINGFLATEFDLYMFFICKKPSDSLLCMSTSGVNKKYLVFQKLDDMFLHPKTLSDEELIIYRKTIDPLRRMNDDVFREACSLENADIEYVAVNRADQLLNIDLTCKSITSLKRRIVSVFPVYISLFGAKEIRIVINHNDLLAPIKSIVEKHCMARQQ